MQMPEIHSEQGIGFKIFTKSFPRGANFPEALMIYSSALLEIVLNVFLYD